MYKIHKNSSGKYELYSPHNGNGRSYLYGTYDSLATAMYYGLGEFGTVEYNGKTFEYKTILRKNKLNKLCMNLNSKQAM